MASDRVRESREPREPRVIAASSMRFSQREQEANQVVELLGR
jgi:hypothetical protein